MQIGRFRQIIWGEYRRAGRKMPWRETRDPYRILVSEVMLQQTQVARVMGFYPAFIKEFPDFRALARASAARVLRAWQGMGYNRRALALKKLSSVVLGRFNGRLPRERAELESLPGIGKTTAGAIRAFTWNEPEVFVETNIRRVFLHFFFPKRARVTDEELMRYIKRALPARNSREWYWALMDYGAMLGAAAKKGANPNHRSAIYKKQPRFYGSDRELRGKVLRFLLGRKKISSGALPNAVDAPPGKVRAITRALIKEGFLEKRGNMLSIST